MAWLKKKKEDVVADKVAVSCIRSTWCPVLIKTWLLIAFVSVSPLGSLSGSLAYLKGVSCIQDRPSHGKQMSAGASTYIQ